MTEQLPLQLNKGALGEESLKNYFQSNGFIAIRGIKYRYNKIDISDVDVFVYAKVGGFLRQRINVDVKNKKTPQAIERIFWTKGLMEALKFDKCVVATTDKRYDTKQFGEELGVQVIDGEFMEKIQTRYLEGQESISEEELEAMLNGYLYSAPKRTYMSMINDAKQLCISQFQYSGINLLINDIKLMIQEMRATSIDSPKNLRSIYFLIGCLEIAFDYRFSQMSFSTREQKSRRITDGFKYGDLGSENIQRMFQMSLSLAESAGVSMAQIDHLRADFEDSLSDEHYERLSDYVSKQDVINGIYDCAKETIGIAYSKKIVRPIDLPAISKGILAIMADQAGIERSFIFEQ